MGKPSTVTLDTDGRVTCTDTSKADIPQTDRAAWHSTLRMSACIGKYDKVKHYTIQYRAKRPDGSWPSDWKMYESPLSLDHWSTCTSEWVADSVGPFWVTLEIDKGQTKRTVQAYCNVQGDMQWSGADWFIKAIIPSWAYSYQGGPGSVELLLKAYDDAGMQVILQDASGPVYEDRIRLYIDNTNTRIDFKENDITIGTPTSNPCPLFTLTGDELTSATLNVEFEALQAQGFLNEYALSLTKCNTPFSVEDMPGGPSSHPLSVSYVSGNLFGTRAPYDAEAGVDDYVQVQLRPTGGMPWLGTNEALSSFTLNLRASARKTDGHGYLLHTGTMQYNIVIRKGP